MRNKSIVIFTISLLLLTSIAVIPVNGVENKQQSISYADPNIIEMIEQINESLVFHYHDNLMSFGPRYTGSENCTNAAWYIYDEFTKMGLDTKFHYWKFDRFRSQNVVGTLHGSDPNSNAIIVMSAHYDCTPGSLGADDDGSGVAAIMAAAHVMSQYSFNHTIRFIAFSGEEVGTYGSFMYAKDAYNNRDNIYAVINVDMVGYADTTEGGNIINFMSQPRAKWIGEEAKTIGEIYHNYTNLSLEIRPNYIGSDHQAFTDYGYDSVWIAHHDGYPWGNSPEDTPDHLNWTYQVKATKFLLAVVAEFAIKKIDVQVMLTHPFEGYAYFFNRPLFPLLFKKGWYTGMRGATIILGRTMAVAEVFSQKETDVVVFCIDGNFMYWDYEPPYEWRIQGKHYPPKGKHTLDVYVYTVDGDIASDEMDIMIFTHSCQYGRW